MGRNRAWTPEEDAIVQRHGNTTTAWAMLNRTRGAISTRLSVLRGNRKAKPAPRCRHGSAPSPWRGTRPCNCCHRMFTSWDIRRNKLCPNCSRDTPTQFDLPATLLR
jgi:hypothetical protein